jgi:hypothetical protein
VLLDGAAIAVKLASVGPVGPVGLRRVIVQMGAMPFDRAIKSHAFSSSSLTSIVIPRTVEILDGSVFSGCEGISISI